MQSNSNFSLADKKRTMLNIQRAHAKFQRKSEEHFNKNRHVDHVRQLARNNVIGNYYMAMKRLEIAFRIVQAYPTHDEVSDTTNIIDGSIAKKI